MSHNKKIFSQSQYSQALPSHPDKKYPIQGYNQTKDVDLSTLSHQERVRLNAAVIMLVDYILSASDERA